MSVKAGHGTAHKIMGRVLIVDGNPQAHTNLTSDLEQDKHVLSHAGGVAEARRAIGGNRYEAILTAHTMPDGTGLDVLGAARDADANVSVIILSAAATPELVLESLAKGFLEFLSKPFTPEVLRAAVQRACDRTTILRENSFLKAEIGRLEVSGAIIGETPAIRETREKIGRVAPMPVPVLITGEPGTGKALAARAIHRQSSRSAKPFLCANCAAFTGIMLESELFGHERGAFAGADRSRIGLFEAAHEGTLLLDEVAETSPIVQSKLLRFLSEGQIQHLGSAQMRTVDVRVLATTRQDLGQLVKEGRFREELYYLLTAVPIALPPLRERSADLEALCEWFLGQVARELNLAEPRLSAQALLRLQSYEFPGNVRELRNLIERAVILSPREEIGAEYFPVREGAEPAMVGGRDGNGGPIHLGWIETLPASFDLRTLLSTLEKTLIERTLQSTHGAQAEAARRLGLSRSDLSYKLLKYQLRKESSAAS